MRRKRLGYEQKQIAVLLGDKNTYQISRYETGQRSPSLREAIMLSILYGLPLSILFERLFINCRQELENTINKRGLAGKIGLHRSRDLDFCSYLESITNGDADEESLDKARHHIKILVEERSNKILETR